ncbi:hypothetical protein WOLCODRAFT_160643 [Wolfiporia cocos MD-104 SS10]|uniref:Uncharacterized protein n=1 Tax=Wolfiporia cocos (strain MD-104) TaxID=742152 RepID=A0A2H3IVX9_WOLCO|nr:hypothetical protein WOLCODRAFT_160643 [Wolfiporia cocos MD-104 SS10]
MNGIIAQIERIEKYCFAERGASALRAKLAKLLGCSLRCASDELPLVESARLWHSFYCIIPSRY